MEANVDNGKIIPPPPPRNFDYRKNGLNTIKIIAAIQVLYNHTITHLQLVVPTWITSVLGFFMGVPIFFMLSGFLIWNSVGKSKGLKEYASKRFGRIFPELWLGVVIELICIVLLIDASIDWLLLAIFAFTQGTVLQFWTPNFLRAYGCGTPNGSLWTMGVTIQFYIAVWFVYKLLHNKRVWIWVVAIATSIAIKLSDPLLELYLPILVYKLWGQTIIKWFWLFIIGAFIGEYREKVLPFLKKTWWLLLAISILCQYLGFDVGKDSYGLLTYATRVPGLIGLAYCMPHINLKIDISYGIYIYHMIIVNIMIELGFVGKIYYLFIVLIITLLLAFGSYCFAEHIKKKRKD